MNTGVAGAAAGDPLVLHTYWRSSAAYRVRIGLNLKGLTWQARAVHLVREGGQQHAAAYRELNPQQLVPTLQHGQQILVQSMAILEYLDEAFPEAPLLPPDAAGRARVRGLAQLVACDVHPLNNLRVMQYLERSLEVPAEARTAWTLHWMAQGLGALESMLSASPATGTFCHGEQPGLADACLVPQLYNARRVSLDLTPYPLLQRVEAACLALPAFDAARPERQADAA
ncbi:maleylacetoacetate isomerase [Xanthomonas sp. 60]